MSKAKITLPGGCEVQIEGTPEEIKELLSFYSSSISSDKSDKEDDKSTDGHGHIRKKTSKRSGPADLIRELIDEGYFKGQKRSLSDIQKKLEERGHIYAQTSLSTPLTRFTRSKELRRLKEKKGWMYVV